MEVPDVSRNYNGVSDYLESKKDADGGKKVRRKICTELKSMYPLIRTKTNISPFKKEKEKNSGGISSLHK